MPPVGFANSSFAKTRAEPLGTILRNSTIGVFPTASRMPDDRLAKLANETEDFGMFIIFGCATS